MNGKYNPLVSIITVSYNSENTIEDTILSVINQNYKNIEYIIVDGGSKDNTIEIIKKYEDKISKWISEKDNGMYDAINKGIKLSTGSIIGIINSDDWYENDAIYSIVKCFDKNRNTGIVHGILRYIKNEKEYSIESINDEFLSEKMIPHPTCFVKRTIYERLNFYSLRYKYASDYDFMTRAKKAGVVFNRTYKIIANFRMEGISYSSKIVDIEFLEIQKENNNISNRRYYFKKIFLKLREMLKL